MQLKIYTLVALLPLLSIPISVSATPFLIPGSIHFNGENKTSQRIPLAKRSGLNAKGGVVDIAKLKAHRTSIKTYVPLSLLWIHQGSQYLGTYDIQ